MGYVLVANDRRFKGLFCEPPFGDNCETDLFEVSAADTVLVYLWGEKASTGRHPSGWCSWVEARRVV